MPLKTRNYRKPITASVRKEVFDKFGGRCAYCGCELGERFHVDHIQAVYHKGLNMIDNLNPACRRCNLRKAAFGVEELRNHIADRTKMLTRYSADFRLANDFGLLAETGKSVVFYFEEED